MRQSSILSVLVAVALLAGCGGGGSSVPTSPAAVTSTAAPSGNPIATANLTVKFPATFQQAAMSASSARLTPSYVNPGAYFLDVFVDGQHVIAPATHNVVNSAQGTQTFTLPIYSTAGHQVVAIESNALLNTGFIIALGEFDIPANSFSPGDTFAVGLTMQMSVQNVGFMTNTSGAGASITPNFSAGCPSPMPFTVGPLYPFAADVTGGFVTNAGLGSVTPTVTNWLSNSASPTSTLTTTANGQNQGYSVTFNSDAGVQVDLSVLNPAYVIQQDVFNNQNDYPGIQSLYNGGHLSSLSGITSTNNYVKNIQASC